MKKIAAIAIAFFASVTVSTAFEIGDGQYTGTYNNHNFDIAESKFNTITVPKQNDVPVGTIISWSLSTDPEDAEYWLECDGREVDPNTYPELYAMMTHTPDYRGRFLVGAGKDGRAVETIQESNLAWHDFFAQHDFKVAYHKSVNLQSSTSKEPYDCSYWDYKYVSSVIAITGPMPDFVCPRGYTQSSFDSCRKWITKTCYKDTSTYYNYNITFGTGDNTGVPINLRAASEGNETRPVNYAVRYLIRAKKVE